MKCKDRFAIPAANCDDCALFAVRRALDVARKGGASPVIYNLHQAARVPIEICIHPASRGVAAHTAGFF